MAESPTIPHSKPELQILRTRHPPATYINQLSELLSRIGIGISADRLTRHLEEMSDKERFFLAVEGESLIGYAQLRVLLDHGYQPYAEMYSIVVQPERRREGIGRHLIAAAESWALQANISHIRLINDTTNPECQAFFASLGYIQDSSILAFVRDLD